MNIKHKIAKFLLLIVSYFSILLLFSCASTPKYSEYSPAISADGKTLIYQADIDKQGSYKIYIKQKILGKWGNPIIINSVNSEFSDGGCFITYDQNSLIFTSNRAGGKGKADLWISQRQGDNWSVPVNMGAPINTARYEGFPSLSPDGKTLYFVGEFPGKSKCKNKLGIFFSNKVNGRWTRPKKMPSPINSEYCEFGPVILADNLSLIFSSTRPGGFGEYDLYKSEKTERGGWSEPVNLGSFINTKDEDSLVSIPASGEIMYYTKTKIIKKKGKACRIFSVPIPPELQQTKVVVVKGVVRNKKDLSTTLHADISIADIRKSAKTIIIESNKEDGKYIVILNKGKVCDFSVSCPGYMFYSEKIDLTGLKKYKEINKDILLEPIVVGVSIVLHNIYFKTGKHRLLEESEYELDRLVKVMRENTTMKVEISGHTDNVGGKRYNKKLSKRRAKSVVKYLIKEGISRERLIAMGYGPEKPVASNKTKEGRKENRRVEFKILHVD